MKSHIRAHVHMSSGCLTWVLGLRVTLVPLPLTCCSLSLLSILEIHDLNHLSSTSYPHCSPNIVHVSHMAWWQPYFFCAFFLPPKGTEHTQAQVHLKRDSLRLSLEKQELIWFAFWPRVKTQVQGDCSLQLWPWDKDKIYRWGSISSSIQWAR